MSHVISVNAAVRVVVFAVPPGASASALNRSTGRVGEALRSTHFQSSVIMPPFSIAG